MQQPLLTIVIPTFRAERTLQASLDSVLGQDLRDLEVLIVDGGSQDGTSAIALAAAASDPRVYFFSEPDKGVYDAMNKGIAKARGAWIYFFGSDDVLHNSKVLTSVFNYPGYDNFDLLYGDVISPAFKGRYDGRFDFTKLLNHNISHQAMFYRKTLFNHFAVYDLRYKSHADWDLNIRLFSDGSVRTCYIGEIIADFGPDGISASHDVAFLREVLFPRRLQWLQQTGLHALRPLMTYDEWWRLLRNGEFMGRAVLGNFAGSAAVPAPIYGMMAWQEKIPRSVLKIGFCSKILMFASYLRHLLSGAFKEC